MIIFSYIWSTRKSFSVLPWSFFTKSKKISLIIPQKNKKCWALDIVFTQHSASFFPALPFDQPLHIWEVGSLGFMRIHQFLFSLALSFNPLCSVKSYKLFLNFETYILQTLPFPQNALIKYKASREKNKV